MMWDVPGAFMLVWLVFGLLLIALVVVAIVWAVRSISSSEGRSQPPASWAPGSAREELDRRYARGEIDRDQYLQIREDLEGPRG